MIAPDALPLWLAVPVAVLLVLGSTLTLLGAVGLVRLRSFYERLHAPTLGSSWGAAAVLLAAILAWSWIEGRPVLQPLVIGVFLLVTTPVTLMLLGRAALHRDRAHGSREVPPPANRAGPDAG